MTDRLPSDHPSVETHRLTLDRRGRLDRPGLDLTEIDADLPADEVVRLTLDGETYYARLTETFEGTLEIRGAYDNPRLARDGAEGTNRLAEWRSEKDMDFGRSVLFDVVVPGYAYGLRAPGERTVYEVTTPPDESLQSIARSLDGDR